MNFGVHEEPWRVWEPRQAVAVEEEERLERRELVPRQPHARANNNLWKHFPTRFSPGRPN